MFIQFILLLILPCLTYGQWKFNREISINNLGAEVSEAVVEIHFKSATDFDYAKTKAKGEDIRFSTSGSLAGTGLAYWIEQWNDVGISSIWVKVPILASQSITKVYMFYGNNEALAVSNGEATFLFFDDFEAGAISNKWTNNSIGSILEQGGLLRLKEADGQEGSITANYLLTGKLIVRSNYQRENGDGHWTRGGLGGWNYWFCYGDHTESALTGVNYLEILDSTSMFEITRPILTKVPNGTVNKAFRPIAFMYDGNKLVGMQDNTKVEWPAIAGSSKLSIRTLDNDASDFYTHISVSKFITPEPTLSIGPQGTVSVSILPIIKGSSKVASPKYLMTGQRYPRRNLRTTSKQKSPRS
jgi:hypothetical protein